MKRIFLLSFIFSMLAVAASAQIHSERSRHERMERGFRDRRLTPMEKRHLAYDQFRINMARRRAERDGFISPFERRRIIRMKKDERRDLFRFRHNRFRRPV